MRALRRRAATTLLNRTLRRCAPLPSEVIARPAIVLAPHPDDEVLGCGGLIARKRAVGASVTVVFMTDGAASHDRFEDRTELAAQRRREALSACATLGVPPDEVHFLDVSDGQLAGSVREAAAALDAILGRARHRQLVLPHPAEPPADHEATFRVAAEWTAGDERRVDLLLYPVWLWDQWPFTNPFSEPGRGSRRAIVRTMLAHRAGTGLGRLFDHRLDISEQLPLKRAALAEHASQTVRTPGEPDRPTLADVADGEWLELLLQPVELYELR